MFRITRQDVYNRVKNMRLQGHDLAVHAQGEPRALWITSIDESIIRARALSPREAGLWLDGWAEHAANVKHNTPVKHESPRFVARKNDLARADWSVNDESAVYPVTFGPFTKDTAHYLADLANGAPEANVSAPDLARAAADYAGMHYPNGWELIEPYVKMTIASVRKSATLLITYACALGEK